jgi:membrane-bound lytic murein transglycosylase D
MALLAPLLLGPSAAWSVPPPQPESPGSYTAELLPRPAELRAAVDFWVRVYSTADTGGRFIHDARYPDVVYEAVQFPRGTNLRSERRHIDEVSQRYRQILRRLAAGEEPAGADEVRVAALWQAHGLQALAEAADRLRFQRGQADRFRTGLTRAGAWRDYIADTLREAGAPQALAALPHVESSFDPTARPRHRPRPTLGKRSRRLSIYPQRPGRSRHHQRRHRLGRHLRR